MSAMNENNYPFFEPFPVRKITPSFNENRDMDSGEIDPETGERIMFTPVQKITQDELTDQLTSEQRKRFERGVCIHCGQDPCSSDCLYR